MTATLFVLAAPSGTGKTTVAKKLLAEDANLVRSVSCTTREKRGDEEQGKSYFFTDEQAFLDKEEAGGFLEFAKIYGHYYGTPRDKVEEALAQGKDVLLVLDWQGAKQLKKAEADCISIFMVPPSCQDLVTRLQTRAEDSSEDMLRRLHSALDEFEHYRDFDYLVVNSRVEEAVLQVQSIIAAQRLTVKRQERDCADLLVNLRAQLQKMQEGVDFT